MFSSQSLMLYSISSFLEQEHFTKVHQVGETVNVDYFSVDGVSDHELLLDEVVKQRGELQHLEVNLKARLIARSEVTGIHERFDSQIKQHITSNVKLQEQLHEREKTIMDLQRTLDDKDKELHAIRLDHEAAWAKEDLIREQQKKGTGNFLVYLFSSKFKPSMFF
ncbi:hypothetical protein HanXRQr2_Chr15g0690821 [Helianthus annuus]|uniref:Uncharacterized protein n=1 Tax=Helianthus annuus TaxID=4232 RepID=A0A251S8F8_HELAN|nr:hypothetical protein HanXRQr2_Chr15g0690821 [Helianthus annuus]